MLSRLLAKARYLTVVPVLGLLAACSSLFVMGGRLILHQLWVALNIPKGQLANNPILPTFEVESLQGINLLLVGTGCLTLALGGAGMTLVTFALLAFKYWGGEPNKTAENED